MQESWVFVGIFFLIAAVFPAAPIILQSLILGPKKNNPVKNSTYECGIETFGDTWVQFKMQYYIFTLVFVVFDVGMMFLFPFAVAYGQAPAFTLLVVIGFLAIICSALVYVWRKGALRWV
ncbi:MAG: NADH-quinone oxidoreductase subunit A [Anaerolineales bacterium]|nr:NADH-quinone oxidoreductase subunit A [Anaerolineales bacterium]